MATERDVGFGGDSFLDVIANTVAILIILIVLAGVKISRYPGRIHRHLPEHVEAAQVSESSEMLTTSDTNPMEVEIARTPSEFIPPASTEEGGATNHHQQEEEGQASLERLEQDNQSLKEYVARLVSSTNDAKLTLSELENQIRHEAQTQQFLDHQLVSQRQALEESEQRLQKLQDEIAQSAQELRHWQQQAWQLEQEEEVRKRPQVWEHRTTPVGRINDSIEHHFRLRQGKVTVIPLEVLLLRLREQIEKKKEWLVKGHQSEGVVGPVAGFSLKFVVQRDRLSPVEELRYGSGVFRLSVSSWQLIEDAEVYEETAEEALQPGSHFLSALATAKPEATLTFWVYPDSFQAYNSLRSFCAQRGHWVAGRPLPDGMPIAGSPHGARSLAQ